MKNINKYFIGAIVLFVTGSVWCARTATTTEAKTRKITTRVAPTRKITRKKQQKIAPINESDQDQIQAGSIDQYVPMSANDLVSNGLGYDIKETKNSVIVAVYFPAVDVPGYKLSNITVKVDTYNNMIVSSKETQTTDERGLTTIYVALSKQIPLPCPVDIKRMVKKVSNGVLTITLPKL